MLYKISKAGSGVAFFIMSVLFAFGFEVPDELVENAVAGVIAILSLILMVWGQIDRKDLKWGLFRK